MAQPQDPLDRPPKSEAALGSLADVLIPALDPIAPPPRVEQALQARLLARVARSALQNRVFSTVRHHDGSWRSLAAGVACKDLPADGRAEIALLRFDALAELPLDPGATVEEWLILSGELVLDGQVLRAGDHLLIGASTPRHLAHSPAGATLYRRICRPGRSAFAALSEGHLSRLDDAEAWVPFSPGVDARLLAKAAQDGLECVSMMLRMRAGASAAHHSHVVGEECVMVRGDVFLGDLLLREGEFQWAPAGTDHGTVHSDVGCLLFFHGVVDPDLQADH